MSLKWTTHPQKAGIVISIQGRAFHIFWANKCCILEHDSKYDHVEGNITNKGILSLLVFQIRLSLLPRTAPPPKSAKKQLA
jgi:hypothetical protein